MGLNLTPWGNHGINCRCKVNLWHQEVMIPLYMLQAQAHSHVLPFRSTKLFSIRLWSCSYIKAFLVLKPKVKAIQRYVITLMQPTKLYYIQDNQMKVSMTLTTHGSNISQRTRPSTSPRRIWWNGYPSVVASQLKIGPLCSQRVIYQVKKKKSKSTTRNEQ